MWCLVVLLWTWFSSDKLQMCNIFRILKYQSLCDSGISSFPCAGVSFWLRGTTYLNNSLVTLEDIGEDVDTLFCVTDQNACCRPPYTGVNMSIGNWYFPNGSRVLNSGDQWDFHRTRSQSVVRLHRRRGGVNGIYRCDLPDAMNVVQTIYIGVYTADTGESLSCISIVWTI